MAKKIKTVGTNERRLAAKAESITGKNYRQYGRSGALYFDVKDYHGFPVDTVRAVAERFAIDYGQASEALEKVYQWHGERWLESADECARFIFYGDESGVLDIGTRAWHAGSKLVTGGRSGGWVSVDHPIFTDTERRTDDRDGWKLNRAELRKVRKWLRNLGAEWDYLIGAESCIDSIENNLHVFEFPDPIDVSREAENAALRETVPAGAD